MESAKFIGAALDPFVSIFQKAPLELEPEFAPIQFDPNKPIYLQLGELGESYALRYLEQRGMRLIEKNWSCRAGEIDIIFREGRDLVFVEVKTRFDSWTARKYLLDNVTEKKKRRLRRLADLYMLLNFNQGFKPGHKPRDKSVAYPDFRIDVVGVLVARDSLEAVSIEHIVGAL